MTSYNFKICIFMVHDVRKYTHIISNAQAHACEQAAALLTGCSHRSELQGRLTKRECPRCRLLTLESQAAASL